MNIVILAAGQGKRMRPSLPKVLHPIAGRPMPSGGTGYQAIVRRGVAVRQGPTVTTDRAVCRKWRAAVLHTRARCGSAVTGKRRRHVVGVARGR